MKKQDVIIKTIDLIKRDAYQSRVQLELKNLGFDVGMMKYHQDISNGKSFGAMQVLSLMTGKPVDDVYEAAIEEAIQDIGKVDKSSYDNMIVGLLNLAGFSGKEYYDLQVRQVRQVRREVRGYE